MINWNVHGFEPYLVDFDRISKHTESNQYRLKHCMIKVPYLVG